MLCCMPNRTAASPVPVPVEVAHAIAGRLRLRLLGADSTGARLDTLPANLDDLRARHGIDDVELKRAARTVVIRYDPHVLAQDRVLDLAEAAGLVRSTAVTSADGPDGSAPAMGESTEELAALIGIPTSFDRRLVESLALSGASLLGARGVGVVLGGGTTIPAYFAIWFALRRLTGLGRRR